MKYKIGDKVMVVNNGKIYTTYDSWIKTHAPDYLAKYNKSNDMSVGFVGSVVATGEHEDGDAFLYLMCAEDGICLISEEGLELVKDRYEVGDRIVIRSDLLAGMRYGGLTFVPEMADFLGKEVHVTTAFYGHYSIREDFDGYFWTYKMIDHEATRALSNTKTYKTWEVIKELSEHPEKKFARILDGLEVDTDSRGYLTWESGHQFLNVDHIWREVVAKPVNFMTAFKAFNKNHQDIYCIIDAARYDFKANTDKDYSFEEELISRGEWFVK